MQHRQHPQKQHTLHYKTGKLPSFTQTCTVDPTARCAARGTRNTTRKTSPHNHRYNKQATTQYDSPVPVEVPQFMGSLNMHNMNTLHGTVQRTSSPTIRNYADNDGKTGTGGNFRPSHTAPCHICTAQVIKQQQKLHDSCNITPSTNIQYLKIHVRN